MTTNDFRARRLALLGGIALAGLVALVLALPGPSEGGPASSQPGYQAWQVHLRQGDGKGEEDGVFDLYQFDPQQPTAWHWVEQGPGPDDWTDVLVLGPGYVPPDADGKVPFDWRRLEDVHPTSVAELVDWIVATYDHVKGPGDLVVEDRSR